MDQKQINFLQRKTVRVLTAGQVLSGFALGSTLSIGSLLASDLSGNPAWAGAAATFSTLGAASWAIPLARLANAKGRRVALGLGAGIAISGAAMVILSAAIGFFPLLLVALVLLGAGSATGLQARFAAVDLSGSSSRSTGRDLSSRTLATIDTALFGTDVTSGAVRASLPAFTQPRSTHTNLPSLNENLVNTSYPYLPSK